MLRLVIQKDIQKDIQKGMVLLELLMLVKKMQVIHLLVGGNNDEKISNGKGWNNFYR